MAQNDGYLEGYNDFFFGRRGGKKPESLGEKSKGTPVSPKDSGGYTEGYVDGGERDVKPFNPNNLPPTEEIIIVPPSGTGGILFVQYLQTVNATSADGDLFTTETFSFLPFTKGDMWISINGLAVYPANGATEQGISAFYITDSTNTIVRPKGTYQIGDLFHWNGSIANYQIEVDDDVKIIYEI